jgi:hypothetical protein
MHEGRGMWGVEEIDNPMPGVKCSDCHMPRTHKEGMPADDAGDEEGTRVSHRFHVVQPGDAERWQLRPGGDSCVAWCHTDERSQYTRTQYQEWIDEQQGEVAARTDEVTATLSAIAVELGRADWLALMAAQPTTPPATGASAAEWAMLQKAAQNADFVVNDVSQGVHNPEYAKAGLSKAKYWAESYQPQCQLNSAGGYVDGNGVMLSAIFAGDHGVIDGASVTLESSTDAGATWQDVRSVTPTDTNFDVATGPIVGDTAFRLVYEPAEGVQYASDVVEFDVPATVAGFDPVAAATDWLDEPQVVVTLAGTPGSLTFYALTGATMSAPKVYTGPITVTAAGATMLTYWSVNDVGSEAIHTAQIGIDRAAPTVSAPVSSAYKESAAFTLSATDPDSGVAELRYKLDSEATVTVAAASAPVSVTTLGAHKVVVSAVDAIGHESAPVTKSFSVKSTPKVYKSPTGTSYTIRRGSTWKYALTLKRPSGAKITGKKVVLQRSTNNRSWSTYATLYTSSTGYAYKSIKLGTSGTYYWRWYVPSDSKYYSAYGSSTKTVVK